MITYPNLQRIAEHDERLRLALETVDQLQLIDAALRTPEGLSGPRIQESLGISRSTLMRHLLTLRELVGPTETFRNHGVFHRYQSKRARKLFA